MFKKLSIYLAVFCDSGMHDLFSGRALKLARFQWNLYCMEQATKQTLGIGMGNFVAPTKDGHIRRVFK